MNATIEVDLDKLFTGSEWEESVGSILREALTEEIKRTVKSMVKEDPKLKKIIALYYQRAINEASSKLGLNT